MVGTTAIALVKRANEIKMVGEKDETAERKERKRLDGEKRAMEAMAME